MVYWSKKNADKVTSAALQSNLDRVSQPGKKPGEIPVERCILPDIMQQTFGCLIIYKENSKLDWNKLWCAWSI